MSQASLNLRFDTALTAQDPTTALTKLAQELKREGMPQREMYGLFTKYFQKHNEPEDPLCDAIADTMDIISG